MANSNNFTDKDILKITGFGDKVSDNKRMSFSATKSVFSIIIILLLIVALVGVLRGREYSYSFTQLLNDFANAPTIDISQWNLDSLQITGDWGIFDFFKNILNFSINILSVLVFFAGGCVQLIMYLVYFVKIFF